jgi:hypothetical protein
MLIETQYSHWNSGFTAKVLNGIFPPGLTNKSRDVGLLGLTLDAGRDRL